MEIRQDKFEVGDKVTWFKGVKPSWRHDLPDELTVVAVRDIPVKNQEAAQHSQIVTVAGKTFSTDPRCNEFTGWYFEKISKTDLVSVVRVLQQKVDNQKNEIKDLTRKYESAKRVNRGLQRKKDLRLNVLKSMRSYLLFLEREYDREISIPIVKLELI